MLAYIVLTHAGTTNTNISMFIPAYSSSLIKCSSLFNMLLVLFYLLDCKPKLQ